ncbi:MAG: hypothetical protein A2508_03960 [Candidatus Lambdaproteobacteria bacterium RIFOXYD12_FULL_49_8]|uniref:Uncharacterized protein n=1 Tax=Candidatus Lambdaproteobacteria bacterium RIFOXYD2_FULL_50_16 TaxID=1817772 RepID=A0A1F6GDP1_9PROT|nr:MAG: hypothetical protein A2527_04400 [Candidatus Lambdaproteobacteria bacterium RIFOXYD2_FULL_50_16]OGG98308.1 MAG: hypothetical protein A2508_03960 [Candidatus Lambdaproteobacteria bacterium RIFOXYD12_FULL_49_8]
MISLLLKFLIFFLGMYLLYRLAKRGLTLWIRGLLAGPAPQAPSELVACAACGVFFDPKLAIKKKGFLFCSPACQTAGPKPEA